MAMKRCGKSNHASYDTRQGGCPQCRKEKLSVKKTNKKKTRKSESS